MSFTTLAGQWVGSGGVWVTLVATKFWHAASSTWRPLITRKAKSGAWSE